MEICNSEMEDSSVMEKCGSLQEEIRKLENRTLEIKKSSGDREKCGGSQEEICKLENHTSEIKESSGDTVILVIQSF